MGNFGVTSVGIKCPIIREGDDLVKIVVDSILDATYDGKEFRQVQDNGTKEGYRTEEIKKYALNDKDVIGVTESVVARAAGLYVTVSAIANDIIKKFGPAPTICLTNMIYSRNRFSMILKGIARAAKKLILVMEYEDEVGNPRGVNKFTGVDIEKYYTEICEKENCEVEILHQLRTSWNENPNLIYPGVDYIKERIDGFIDCSLHIKGMSTLMLHSWYCFQPLYTLKDICNNKNPDFGVLGSNKATEEKLKLFPTREIAQKFVEKVQAKLYEKTGKNVEVMVYGDGCFKDPIGGIWEFADPVTSPGYTKNGILNGRPNEIKIKAFADDDFKDLKGAELDRAMKDAIKNKEKDLIGNMASQGTTPRRYVDLLASLMDLTSGSGDKGTPIILIQNYFNNYSD